MSSALRVAIAGTGFIGAVHARSARLAGARIVGVSASSPSRSQEAARALGAERAFESSEALVESRDVDVVHICTPNHLHLPLAEAALAAGKHVVCEKPLATDVAGARRLVDAAASSGTAAAVPFVYRYYPTVREARDRVRTGATGPVRLVHGTYLQDWLTDPEDDNWRVDSALGGASRAFADIGSHWCDLAEFITGHRIVRLSARTLTAVPERVHAEHAAAFARGNGGGEKRAVDTEDAAVMQFETDGGAVGSTVISQISPGRKNRLWIEVDGAKQAVTFSQEEPETLWSGTRAGVNLVPRDIAGMSADASRLSFLPAGHPQGYVDCFDLFVADAHAVARGDAPADGMPLFADGLRSAQLVEAVLCSAREQRWVDVPATTPTELGS
ncbi:MAG TPA: Gfo/Idh/MocA family oxidoreductase [Solirubrobacteraceae bacterium]|nr:Gfo/Idh/MocA family oxidoreductase [Solirubrobacteraceae bacterium]